MKLYELLLPALSGFIASLAFWSEKFAFIIFFALVPLLYSILCKFKIYKLAVYAFTLYSSSLVWLSNAVSFITDSKAARIVISLFLVLLVITVLSMMLILPFYIFKLDSYGILKTAVIFPLIYIFGEWLQGIFHPIAFPWLRLGNIASPFTAFIQSASVFGTLFISLLILYSNMLIALLFCNIKKIHKYSFIVSSSCALFINLMFGIVRLDSAKNKEKPEFTVLIVQGNYQKAAKFETQSNEILEKYLHLAYSCHKDRADLIIFPETSINSESYRNTVSQSRICKLCSDFDSMLLFGSQYNSGDKHYNACMAAVPDKIPYAAYLKRILVPYGEYDPLGLSFLDVAASDFSAGDECGLIDSKNGKIGCAICFESVFSDSLSECVKNGAEVIAILTNDTWLGRKIPLYQHHSHSIMRAVENNRFVLTSTNTGISSIVDEFGRTTTKSIMNTESIITGNYRTNTGITPYSKYGNVIILPSCAVIMYCCMKFLGKQIYGLFFKKT